MNTVKQLCLFFGLGQQEFAGYLGISRSMLSMVEMNERELPGTATIKYAALVTLAFGKTGLANQLKPPLAAFTPDETQTLLNRAAEYDYQAEKCRRQLKAVKTAYERATNALALCAHLLPGLTDKPGEKKDRLILEIAEATARRKLRENGPGAQAMLQWQIDGFIDGAARAREIIAAQGGP